MLESRPFLSARNSAKNVGGGGGQRTEVNANRESRITCAKRQRNGRPELLHDSNAKCCCTHVRGAFKELCKNHEERDMGTYTM